MRTRRFLFTFAILAIGAAARAECPVISSEGATPAPALSAIITPASAPQDPEQAADFYRARYGLEDAYAKKVDNFGAGDPDLYGTRNFRTVLYGIQYRGGANNAYLKPHPRNNQNPLPPDGLKHLCEEGFGMAIYLYKTNFSSASPVTQCDHSPRGPNTLQYISINPGSESGRKKILGLIHESIIDYRHGPIYTHCWNGWHESGLISAYSLRQFCDLSGEEAWDYWVKDTDGHPDPFPGASHGIKQKILDFQPDPALRLTPEQQRTFCPSH